MQGNDCDMKNQSWIIIIIKAGYKPAFIIMYYKECIDELKEFINRIQIVTRFHF